MKAFLRVVAMALLLALVAGVVFYMRPMWVSDQMISLHLWREGVKSEYVEAGGYRLHYFEAKPKQGEGKPLVLVHGLGARAEDWGSMMPALAASGFHVYAPDLPGYGRSSKPRDASYSITMEEEAVVAFMRAMNLGRADVGGWSMGGWVSMKLALDHPTLVDRLVIYDSAGIYFPADFGSQLFVPSDEAGLAGLMKVLSPQPRTFPAFVARDILRRMADNGWVVTRSVAAMANGRDLLDFRLHEMKQPLLIVWGSKDELIPLEAGRKIHSLVPGSVMNVVEGCGHLAPSECAKPVIAATDEFLKAEPAMQGGEKTIPGA